MPVDVSYMKEQIFHEDTNVVAAHWNNDLFLRETLSCHLDMWLWFRVAFDNVIDLIDLLSIESQECFLDLEDFRSVCHRSRGLGI